MYFGLKGGAAQLVRCVIEQLRAERRAKRERAKRRYEALKSDTEHVHVEAHCEEIAEVMDPGGRVPITFEWMEELRNRIRQTFYTDILQFVSDKDMTATEVQQRTAERMRLLGPVRRAKRERAERRAKRRAKREEAKPIG